MDPLTVAIAAGSFFQVLGQIGAQRAQGKALQQSADAKRAQAFELLNRTESNLDLIAKQGKRIESAQAAAMIKGGVAIGNSSTSLLQMEQLNQDVMSVIIAERKDAEYRAKAMEAGADVDEQTAKNNKDAGMFNILGSVMSGVGRLM